jgi:hypothetical protein
VILATQRSEERDKVWGMIHEVFRLYENGEPISVATFEDLPDAERLLESLEWEWPGEYVIKHTFVNCSARTIGLESL